MTEFYTKKEMVEALEMGEVLTCGTTNAFMRKATEEEFEKYGPYVLTDREGGILPYKWKDILPELWEVYKAPKLRQMTRMEMLSKMIRTPGIVVRVKDLTDWNTPFIDDNERLEDHEWSILSAGGKKMMEPQKFLIEE